MVGKAIVDKAADIRLPRPRRTLRGLRSPLGIAAGGGTLLGGAGLYRKFRLRPSSVKIASPHLSKLSEVSPADPWLVGGAVAGGAVAGGAAAAAVPAWVASRAGNKLGDALLSETAQWARDYDAPIYREIRRDPSFLRAYQDVGGDPIGELLHGDKPWYARGSRAHEDRVNLRMGVEDASGRNYLQRIPDAPAGTDIKPARKLYRKYGRGAVYKQMNRGRLAAIVAGGAALGGASVYGVHRFRNRDQ